MFLDELCNILEVAGVGTKGATIFLSSQASIPRTTTTLEIVETGGTGPSRTHNATLAPQYVHPAAQITTRSPDHDYVAARAMAGAAYFAFAKVRNQFVMSGWYVSITPLQEPFDPGKPDDLGRALVKFNVIAEKKPTT